jgi:hypothetical protein
MKKEHAFLDEQKLLFEGGKKGFVKNTKLDFMNLYLISLEIKPRWSGLFSRIASDLVGHGIIGLQHLPPRMKNQHGLNEQKTLQEKNNLSIESSEVHVWVVWILTNLSVRL